jgi:hypothetical protein
MKNIVIPIPLPISTNSSCQNAEPIPEWIIYSLIGVGLLAVGTIVGILIFWWRNG